eukprot:1665217-Pleurochrysis_carterae.AAC.4
MHRSRSHRGRGRSRLRVSFIPSRLQFDCSPAFALASFLAHGFLPFTWRMACPSSLARDAMP